MQPPAGAGASEAFRPDIEGLRGVAILLVLLFHAALIGIPGGFIGVDVFFVISGFLITGLLVRERERTGGIGLAAFYARRVRRLLPAGMVALACTLVASFAVLTPLDRPSAALDGAAAALSIGNIRFALAAGDYFASVQSPSPFLHFWSLAVEEQFYLVWPALVLVASRCRRPRLGLGLALGLVVVASLAANVVVTDTAVNWAFYSLPTRAWQLALGGLLAVGAQPLKLIPGRLLTAVGWSGMAALVWAAFSLDGDLAYPGLWAIVPTLAAAAMIASGTTRRGPAIVLSTPSIRFLGRISYSLYLWHWPILVLPVAMMEGELPVAQRLVLSALAVAVAWASWRLIEEPFRAGFPALARHPGRTVLAGAAAVALMVSSASGLAAAETSGAWLSVDAASVRETAAGLEAPGGLEGELSMGELSMGELGAGEVDQAGLEVDQAGLGAPETSGSDDPLATPPAAGAPAPGSPAPGSPSPGSPAPGSPAPGSPAPVSATPDATPSPTPRTYVRLPSDVSPSLANARMDEERLRRDGCLAFEGATAPRDCVYGDPKGSFTVALVGDSHAAQWFPALEGVAEARGWRILTFVKVACPFVDMPVRNLALKREYRECAAFNDATIERLRAAPPDLTLVSQSRFAIHPVQNRDTTVAAQGAALARMLEQIPGHVAVIVDTPDGGRDVPACLSRHVADVRICAVAQPVAFARHLGAIERAATKSTGDDLINLTARICRADPCPVVVDGMIVFRDLRHLTATFSRSLAGDLDRELAEIVDTRVTPSPSAVP
jgi:peptidoglycan/LPS O-acetylase OafA/YrhL